MKAMQTAISLGVGNKAPPGPSDTLQSFYGNSSIFESLGFPKFSSRKLHGNPKRRLHWLISLIHNLTSLSLAKDIRAVFSLCGERCGVVGSYYMVLGVWVVEST